MAPIRVLVVGDIHMTHQPPRARTNDYPRHILAKLAWLAKAAKKLGCQAAVCTGDLYHRKSPEERDITALIEAFKAFPGGFIYSVLGNHDTVTAMNMAGTAYETLVAAGVVKDLANGAAPVEIVEGAMRLHLTGCGWAPEDVLVEAQAYERMTAMRDAYELRITHGMLVHEDRPFPFACTFAGSAYRNLLGPDLLINGHNHKPFDVGNVINLGSICRISKTEDSPRRAMLVLLSGDEPTLSWKPITIPTLDGESVFTEDISVELDRELEVESRDSAIEAFVDGLEGNIDILASSPEALLNNLAQQYEDGSVEAARTYLDRARERLKA